MQRWEWALPALATLALLFGAIVISCSGGDDDDGGDDCACDDTGADDDTGTDDDSLDDDTSDDTAADDDTVSREQRCQDFVHSFYIQCQHTLFDMTEQDAINSCVANQGQIPWDCVMVCWEDNLDCQLWGQCIQDNCDIPQPDDDTGDDTAADDTSTDDAV